MCQYIIRLMRLSKKQNKTLFMKREDLSHDLIMRNGIIRLNAT